MWSKVLSHNDHVVVQDPKSAALIRRTFQQRLNDPPILSFGPLPGQGRAQPLQGRGLALHFSAVQDALPFNVHLLTLKALPESSVLLRLAHLYQVSFLSDPLYLENVNTRARTHAHTHSMYQGSSKQSLTGIFRLSHAQMTLA